MNTELLLQTARSILSVWGERSSSPETNRLDVNLSSDELLDAVNILVDNSWGYLSAITGLDNGPEADLEALYHFCSYAAIVTLRVHLPRQNAMVSSICQLIPSASLYERELSEMLGVTITNAPNTERLFLPDDWPYGIYPLRKDFNPDTATIVEPTQPQPMLAEYPVGAMKAGKFIVPIGPQHPALKEPGHFEFAVDGEVVTSASVRLGYVHRGIEKACEERNWTQALYLLERVCGICSHSHAYAYCLAVERLAQIELPMRAQAIRELVAGLERIHSHLLWLGVAAHEAGFDTLFMYSWRDRETVMDLLEQLAGNRVNYSVNVLGGVKVDVDLAQAEAIRKGLDFLEQRTRHYLDVVTKDASFLQRTRGIAPLSAEQVEQLGVVGPTARASGVTRDIRVEAPYGSYARFPVSVVRETAGDLEAKFVVRIKELFVTYNAIRSILDNLPAGDLTVRIPRKIPAGETISRIEAPRGELFYYVKSDGGDRPSRVKVRTPSMCNFASVIITVVGHQLADVPLILAGIDPCFSCNDRMVVVRKGAQSQEQMSWDALRQYGIEYYQKHP